MPNHVDKQRHTQKSTRLQAVTPLARLKEAQDTLAALCSGAADAVIAYSGSEPSVLTIRGADDPYRLIVEMMGEGTITLTEDGMILYSNDQFAEMVKRPKEQLVGFNFSELLPTADRPKFKLLLDTVTETVSRKSIKLKLPHGQLSTLIAARSMVVSGARSVVATVTDVSSLAKVQSERSRLIEALRGKNAELQRAMRAKDAFLARMSHELRTPLTAVIGYAGTLLMELPGPLLAEQKKQVSTIRSSAQFLLSLINDILDFAKVESGTFKVSREKVACLALVEDLAAILRQLAEQKGLKLKLNVVSAPEMPDLVTDRRALTQILMNLVNNAIKFTQQGSITITIERCKSARNHKRCFHVADTGVGIAPEDQVKLFHAFYQVNDSPGAKGTGLGLYISRKLAGALGGDITFKSVLGKGSTFTLTLPEV